MANGQFKASWWLRGGHWQTIWPILTRKVRIKSRIQRLELPDGDFVRLDWVGNAPAPGGEGGGASVVGGVKTSGNTPIVVVLPGLQGDVSSPYAAGMLREIAARGWRGVLLNYRGRGEPNRLPHSYHCGMTCDLDHLVRLLRAQEPRTPIGVVGFSVGANICMKWLGECGQRGEEKPVAAAVGVSVPFHLGVVAKKIEKGFSRVYQWYLLRSLRRDMKRKMRVMDMGLELTGKELRGLDTFFKFDERVSGPLNGFDGAEDYYARTRSDVMLNHVTVPTLLVNARNDPLVPAHLIPLAADVSATVTLEITETGGHLGFVSGRWPWTARFWLDRKVGDFLAGFLNPVAEPGH